jgi:hypothetical protein
VKEALHVAPDASFFSGDNGDGMNYDLTEQNLMPFYIDMATNYPDVSSISLYISLYLYLSFLIFFFEFPPSLSLPVIQPKTSQKK